MKLRPSYKNESPVSRSRNINFKALIYIILIFMTIGVFLVIASSVYLYISKKPKDNVDQNHDQIINTESSDDDIFDILEDEVLNQPLIDENQKDSSDNDEENSDNNYKGVIYSIGETFSTDDVEWKVNSVKNLGSSLKGTFKNCTLENGNYVLVEYTAKNICKDCQYVDSPVLLGTDDVVFYPSVSAFSCYDYDYLTILVVGNNIQRTYRYMYEIPSNVNFASMFFGFKSIDSTKRKVFVNMSF